MYQTTCILLDNSFQSAIQLTVPVEWRLPTRSGVLQGFRKWEKLVLMYRVSQKKAVKSNPGKILRKCNFNFFNVKNWPIFAGFEPFLPSISILLIFEIE